MSKICKPDLYSILKRCKRKNKDLEVLRVLGLKIVDEKITDKYFWSFSKQLNMIAQDIMNPSGVNINSNINAGKRRSKMIYTQARTDYLSVLNFFSKYDDCCDESLFLEKKKKESNLGHFGDRLTHLIRVLSWCCLGNSIPFGDVMENKVKKYLNKEGFVFLREKGGMGWYFDDQYRGKDYKSVLSGLESVDMWELI